MNTARTKRATNRMGGNKTSANIILFHQPREKCCSMVLLALVLALTFYGSAAFGAAACDDSWNVKKDGEWNVNGNWTQGLPGEKSDVCLTNGQPGDRFTTYLNIGATIRGLNIGQNNALSLTNNNVDVTAIVSNSGTIDGNGTLSVKTFNNLSTGNVRADGTNLVIKPSGGPTFDMVNGHNIQATRGGTLTLQNGVVDNFETINGFSLPGTISASSFGGPKKVSTVKIQGSTINGGKLQVIDFGKILLDNSVVQYRPGSPRGPGSSPRIYNSSVGTIEVSGTSTVTGATLTNPKGGQVQVDGGSELRFGGIIQNGGSVKLLGSRLRVIGSLSLEGAGSLAMQAGSMITATGNGNVLANESRIVGSGSISNVFLQNEGMIVATGTLSLSPNPLINNGPGAINSGTMLALPGGDLRLSLGKYDNSSTKGTGLIAALGVPGLNPGTVTLAGATVTGGRIVTIGTGVLDTLNTTLVNGTLFNNPFGTVNVMRAANPVTFDTDMYNFGRVSVNDGAVLFLKAGHTYSNVGRIALDADAANGSASLVIAASAKLGVKVPVFLTGYGTITLSDSTGNHITGETGKETLFNVNNTIQGAGTIDDLILNNQGTIKANAPNNPLILKPNKTATNSGTIEAVRGSKLTLTLASGIGTLFANTDTGILQATGNSSQLDVNLDSGQTFQNNGTISALNGTVAFSGSGGQLKGLVNNAGNINALSGGTIDFTPNGGVNIVNFKGAKITVYKNGTIHSDKQLKNGEGGVDVKKGGVLDPSIYSQEGGGYTRDDGVLEAEQVNINAGILFGTGVVRGDTVMGGTLFAGDGTPNGGGMPKDPVAGAITINGDYVQTGSGVLDEMLQSESLFSKTQISGTTELGGTLNVSVMKGFHPIQGEPYTILTSTDGLDGDFANALPLDGSNIGDLTADGYSFNVIYNWSDDSYGSVVLTNFVPVPTPEPGSLFLFSSGVIGLSVLLRKRLHKTA